MQDELSTAVERAISASGADIGANGAAFMRRVYAAGLQRYHARLTAVGLATGANLLDAGCGFGQWALAAASGFGSVTGVDVSAARVRACQYLAEQLSAANCRFMVGGLEALPFEDATFDAAISYSVLYFTNYERAIAELGRVLRPSALLYISTNAVGRFLAEIVEHRNAAVDYNPRLYGLATLARTFRHRLTGAFSSSGPVAMNMKDTSSVLRHCGFEVLGVGAEGTLGACATPWVRARYAGITAVFDVLARRR
jgi:SAM-dependent methyltransferase